MLSLVVSFALIGLLVLGLLALHYHQQRTSLPKLLVHAVARSENALLVRDVEGEWRELAFDGKVGDPLPLGRRAVILAEAPGILWVESDDVPLAAYRLPSLERIAAVEEAVRAHRVLARGVVPLGRADDGSLFARGEDLRRYRIALDGSITLLEPNFNIPRQQRITPRFDDMRYGRGQRLGVRELFPIPPDGQGAPTGYRDGEGRPSDVRIPREFVTPFVVWDYARSVPLVLRNPDSWLVAHSELSGERGNPRLSRLAADGSVRWTLRIEDAIGPTEIPGAEHGLLWVGVRGPEVVLLAQAWRTIRSEQIRGSSGRSTYYEAEFRLIRVDAATGEVVGRTKPIR